MKNKKTISKGDLIQVAWEKRNEVAIVISDVNDEDDSLWGFKVMTPSEVIFISDRFVSLIEKITN